MAQAFSFGFSNEDIDIGEEEDVEMQEEADGPASADIKDGLAPPRLHSLQEMISTLPSSISYSTPNIQVHSPSGAGAVLALPRRDLYDIRAQLMAEADVSESSNPLTAGLSADDIKPGIYEGGFKTWECSIDLAKYLHKECTKGSLHAFDASLHVIELGAGTALPTLTILSALLRNALPTAPSTASDSTAHSAAKTFAPSSTTLTLADYNASVLSHATVPNLLLTTLASDLASTPAAGLRPGPGEVELTAESLAQASALLAHERIGARFVSGAWGDDFTRLVAGRGPDLGGAESQPQKGGLTLLLASETIYSPASLGAFVSTLKSVLAASGHPGREADGLVADGPETAGVLGEEKIALVAAKKVYFGVGGGVDEFSRRAGAEGMVVKRVWDSDDDEEGEGKGVGRCILEVRAVAEADLARC